MVFVTVGNATQGFKRLLDAVEHLADEGFFKEDPVLIQSGNNPDFRPHRCQHVPFFSMEEFQLMIHKAGLIISHAGAGTLLHVLQAGQISVVMPRRKQYGELVDDHQVELVRRLAAERRVIAAYEPEDLRAGILEARNRNRHRPPFSPPPSCMMALVARAIEELGQRNV